MVIGAETVLEIVTDDDWYCVVSTSEAINHLLLEIDFAKSLRYRVQYTGGTALGFWCFD